MLPGGELAHQHIFLLEPPSCPLWWAAQVAMCLFQVVQSQKSMTAYARCEAQLVWVAHLAASAYNLSCLTVSG